MGQDSELIELRARVDCRVVLEQAGWLLDERESTRRAAKYRHGAGEIVIVTHDGKGWFDPLAEASRGDVLALAQRLWGGNLGHARKALRPLAGIIPLLLPMPSKPKGDIPSPATVWMRRAKPRSNSAAWRYLTAVRGLPAEIIAAAADGGLIREGVHGTAWFRHDIAGRIVGWEMRGPSYKGYLAGGAKGLFVWSGSSSPSRVAVCESAIDALSLAAIEGRQEGTAYVSTAGGWGNAGAIGILELMRTATLLVAATDQGTGGDLLAGRLEDLTKQTGIRFEPRRPSAKDWNVQLLNRESHYRTDTKAFFPE